MRGWRAHPAWLAGAADPYRLRPPAVLTVGAGKVILKWPWVSRVKLARTAHAAAPSARFWIDPLAPPYGIESRPGTSPAVSDGAVCILAAPRPLGISLGIQPRLLETARVNGERTEVSQSFAISGVTTGSVHLLIRWSRFGSCRAVT
jgi:hypothetical protein